MRPLRGQGLQRLKKVWVADGVEEREGCERECGSVVRKGVGSFYWKDIDVNKANERIEK